MRQRSLYLLLTTLALSACNAQPNPPAGWHAGCAPYWDASATPPPGGWAPNCPAPANAAHQHMTPPPGWHVGCKPYWDETATPPPGGWAPNCPGNKGWSLLPSKPVYKPVDITTDR
jgi:hypothetical protein